MLFLLRKSLKSLQNRLHEFFWQWADSTATDVATAGALTRARAKLLPSVFVELNQTVLSTVYGQEYGSWARRWRGHRVLGIDSSTVRLPNSPALREHFGSVQFKNQHGRNESYAEARVSVLYDLLNEVALDTRIAPGQKAETEMALEHLTHVQKGDVLVTDRGYRGWGWFAAVQASGTHFVCRCPRGSFTAVQELFARDEAGVSVRVKLPAPKPERARARVQGWPLELSVRLITVRLSTGELEVLATSLLDETAYPTESFGALYGSRWGHETYYGRLKGRLDLEHCSGQTVAAVEQDFQAMILLSNIESVLIGPAQAELSAQAKTTERAQCVQVNRAVSLHALKYRLIELLASERPLDQLFAELTKYFQQNPVSVRPGREVPRRKFSPSRSYHYQRRVRKLVY